MRVFWDQGYRATTLANLMRVARVQKQSLYCAFGDKRSLFLKSLKLYRNQVLSQIQGQLNESESPLEGIARLMRHECRPPMLKNYPPGCLMANTALELGLSDSDVAAEVKKLFRGFEKALTAAVRKAQERGEITTRFDSTSIGQSLANTINGIRILQNTGASNRQIKAVADMALATIKK